MKVISRYRSAALFDLFVSFAAVVLALVDRDVYVHVSLVYFAYLAFDSLREYLSLHR